MFRKIGAIYQATSLAEIPWLDHGFGTRHASAWPGECPIATLRQVHSDKIRSVDGSVGCLGEGDALITGRTGVLLGIRTADCLPLLLVERRRRVVAAVHAGWRGSAARIAVKTVDYIHQHFGGDPDSILVAIGPGIGRCCYEVGREVAVQFWDHSPELVNTKQPLHLDLAEINKRQLISAGVPTRNITGGTPCTYCNAREFHSYRRDGAEAGRMTSAIGVKVPAGAP